MGQVNGAFRKKKVNFSMVSNIALRDKKLSLKAKGLYSLIQSYITIESDDFILTKALLHKMCQEGERAFNGAWNELKDNGYLKIFRQPDIENKGVFLYEYELLDTPNIETPSLVSYAADGSQRSVIEIAEKKDKVHNPPDGDKEKNIEYTNVEYVEKLLRIKLSDKQQKVIETLDKEKLITSVRLTTAYENKRPDEYYKLLIAIYNNPKNHERKEAVGNRFYNSKAQSNNGVNYNGFNNFEPRKYDYDDLEKKLLGWDND